MTTTTSTTRERADLLQALEQERQFLRFTVRGLTDEQAAATPTASELCLGGLIKHVTGGERGWVDFILDGAQPQSPDLAEEIAGHVASFRMLPGETLTGLLEEYERVARRTDDVVHGLPDLGISQTLPEAPWFPPGAQWSARLVLLHIIAETAHHAGHADILRETIDGQKTMG